jgi:hypothetical protein
MRHHGPTSRQDGRSSLHAKLSIVPESSPIRTLPHFRVLSGLAVIRPELPEFGLQSKSRLAGTDLESPEQESASHNRASRLIGCNLIRELNAMRRKEPARYDLTLRSRDVRSEKRNRQIPHSLRNRSQQGNVVKGVDNRVPDIRVDRRSGLSGRPQWYECQNARRSERRSHRLRSWRTRLSRQSYPRKPGSRN